MAVGIAETAGTGAFQSLYGAVETSAQKEQDKEDKELLLLLQLCEPLLLVFSLDKWGRRQAAQSGSLDGLDDLDDLASTASTGLTGKHP